MTDRAEPGDPPVCGFKFDSTVCVAAPGHPGPHITSNASYPHGLAREPGDPLDLDQIEAALDDRCTVRCGDYPENPFPTKHDSTCKKSRQALRDARQRVQDYEAQGQRDMKEIATLRRELDDVAETLDSVGLDYDHSREERQRLEAALAAAAEREKELVRLVGQLVDAMAVVHDEDGRTFKVSVIWYETAKRLIAKYRALSPTPTEPHQI